MEYRHIKDIDFEKNIKERVFGIFLARDVEVRTQKDNVTKYLSLTMCDKECQVKAKKFGATAEEIEKLKNGHVYYAAIDIKEYSKDPSGYSCTLYNFEVYDENPANFINWAEGMEWANGVITATLTKLNNSIYKQLVYNILNERWKDFIVWVAASSLHHNLMGGLLVHTAEVIEQAEKIAEFWQDRYGENFINMSLLLSGAILHDIAKTYELNLDRETGITEYNSISALETHITMCTSLIDIEAYKLGLGVQDEQKTKTEKKLAFEKESISLLKHLILSHHGKLEYGSPIVPNCPEAYILNTADLLSSEMFRYNKNFKLMEPSSSNCVWLSGNMVNTYKDGTK